MDDCIHCGEPLIDHSGFRTICIFGNKGEMPDTIPIPKATWQRVVDALRHADNGLRGEYPWPVPPGWTKKEAKETAHGSVREALTLANQVKETK